MTGRSLSLPMRTATLGRARALLRGMKAREGLLADVLAELHPVERDLGHGLVGALDRDIQVCTERRDAQHPSTDGRERAVLAVRRRVEHHDIPLALQVLDPANGPTRIRRF